MVFVHEMVPNETGEQETKRKSGDYEFHLSWGKVPRNCAMCDLMHRDYRWGRWGRRRWRFEQFYLVAYYSLVAFINFIFELLFKFLKGIDFWSDWFLDANNSVNCNKTCCNLYIYWKILTRLNALYMTYNNLKHRFCDFKD